MKPAPFDYYAPASLMEATTLLAEMGDEGKVIAGGQSLVPMLNLRLARFEALVDVTRVPELHDVEHADGAVRIGAAVTQADIERDAAIRASVPLLAMATPLIGHFQIRSRGTIGGSIAHADPAAEYPAVALTLDADISVVGPSGRRTVSAADFFLGNWLTSAADDEIVTAVSFPAWGSGSGFAVDEVARRHGDFAIAGAAVGVTVTDGVVSRAAIGLLGLGSTPIRASAAEASLLGLDANSVDARAIGELAIDGLEPPEDLHASSALRLRIGTTVVRRAVRRALEEATHG